MDKMIVKITGGVLSIAILLITGRAKAARLQSKPASISNGIGRLFQLVLEGVNLQLTRVAGFSSNWKIAALSLLTGDAITNTNPVMADLNGNNITGNGLNSNFPAGTNISTHSRQPDVISDLFDIGYFRNVSPDLPVNHSFLLPDNTGIISRFIVACSLQKP